MRKQWRNLGVLVVIAAAAIAAYYLTPELLAPPDFEAGAGQLSTAYSARGVDVSDLSAAFPRIAGMAASDRLALNNELLSFKAKMSGYESGDGLALYKLSDIYLGFNSLAESYSELQDSLGRLTTATGEPCGNLALHQEVRDDTEAMFRGADKLNQELTEFYGDFPGYADGIGITFPGLGVPQIAGLVAEQQGTVALLEEMCGGGL